MVMRVVTVGFIGDGEDEGEEGGRGKDMMAGGFWRGGSRISSWRLAWSGVWIYVLFVGISDSLRECWADDALYSGSGGGDLGVLYYRSVLPSLM